MFTPMISSSIVTAPSSLQSPVHSAAAVYAPSVVTTHINTASALFIGYSIPFLRQPENLGERRPEVSSPSWIRDCRFWSAAHHAATKGAPNTGQGDLQPL